MIREARFVARKDLAYMLTRKETLIWTFVMPILFFYFIGTVTSGIGSDNQGKDNVAVFGALTLVGLWLTTIRMQRSFAKAAT